MFTVSDNAVNSIRRIVAGPDVPPGAGLRIAADQDRGSLNIAVSTRAEPGDTVYEASDVAQLFIAKDAEELLDDRTIDTREDGAGRIQFVLDTLEQ